jgi:signal transduction histidine kinase
MPSPLIRFPIAYKLLFWCFSLILIFYLTTAFLLDAMRGVVMTSDEIVTIHYRAAEEAERMIQQLLVALEYTKRYQILENERDHEAYRLTLKEYGRSLERLGAGPQVSELRQGFDLSVTGEGEWTGEPDEVISQWMVALAGIRDEHRERMRTELEVLTSDSESAASVGLVGMIVSLGIGLTGSVFIAVLLNRSLRELRNGITRLHRTGGFVPVRRVSGDELGDLSVAFNQMAVRLRKEEELRLEFLSMLNQEMDAPLHTIEESLGRISRESSDRLTPAQQRVLGICRREVGRLGHLMDRLLKLSSIEVGNLPVNAKPMDARTLIDDALSRIEAESHGRDVGISVASPDRGACTVLGDAEHLRQVLSTLFKNALLRSEQGSTIGLRVDPDPRQALLYFRVGDKGRDIPPQEQEQLFSPYARSPFSDDDEPYVGLDLSISKRIVEVHGGSMWYENKPGRGNIFGFSLPMIKA